MLLLLPANAPSDPAAAFGARESIQSISLSPDGRQIAYVAPAPSGQGARLYTVDLASGQPRLATGVDGTSQRLGGCGWVSNTRLVCNIYAAILHDTELVYSSRLVAVDRDGSNVTVLGERDTPNQISQRFYGGEVIDWLPGEDDAVLMTQIFVPEGGSETRLARSDRGFGVVRVDTRTGRSRRVELPRTQAVEYISDGRGRVRIMGLQTVRGASDMAGNVINYSYRPSGSSQWQSLASYNLMTGEGFNPVAVDPDLDAVYGLEKRNGRNVLVRLALDGSGRKEVLVAHEQVDVDRLIRVGRSRRVVGASYATERREAVFFDPELRRLAEQLSTALPGLPLIRFAGASADERRLLIWAGSDTDPGRYYLYEKDTNQLAEIMLSRPQLERVRLAEVRPISYSASDGTMVPAYLTLPPGSSGRGLPAIVMPHGGPGARDEWGFDWLAQFYANRGFAVLQPNFRGSTGYGDAWFQQNGFQSWRTAIGDVADAGRWLANEGIADPSRLAIVGWSYGGYAALQANVLQPGLFKAVVAIAPVTDLAQLREEWRGFSNYAMTRDFIGTGAHIREGSPAQNAAAIGAPVLLVHGDRDRNVAVAQSRLMHDRLRNAGGRSELIVFPGLDHQLDDSAARTELLRRSEAFLRSHLAMGGQGGSQAGAAAGQRE